MAPHRLSEPWAASLESCGGAVRSHAETPLITMVLSAGQSIGPYEIVSALGAGGMGEVYRAHDTKLRRDVALKILPADVSEDPERLARSALV